MANTSSFIPQAFVIKDLVSLDPSNFLKPFNFTIKGSQLAIERIVCRYSNSFVFCGFIHTGHLLSWVKLKPAFENRDLVNLTLVTSRTFENHADWTPNNLEVSEALVAVEAIATRPDKEQMKYPRILVYNVSDNQYVWYSISLQECAVTTIDVLSFILTSIKETDNKAKYTIIVANRRDNSNLLMYYETRPMVLSIKEVLSKDELSDFSLLISNSSQTPLIKLLSYSEEAIVWTNFQLFATAFCGVLIIMVLGIWIFKRITNDNIIQIPTSN